MSIKPAGSRTYPGCTAKEVRFSIVMPPRRFALICLLAAVAVLAALTGCETNSMGPQDTGGIPPLISAPRVSPDRLNIDSLTPSGGSYTITFNVMVRAEDELGPSNVRLVRADVFEPAGGDPFMQDILHDDGVPPDSAAADGIYSGEISFHARRDEAGLYRVRFGAQNGTGLRSTSLYLPFLLTRRNSAPRLDSASLVAPDTLNRPAADSSFFMSIAASDSDGLGDIRQVYLENLSSHNRSFLLDDGGVVQSNGISSGDRLAGDGVFSIILFLPSGQPAGTYRFRLQAQDTFGDTSNSVPYTLVIQ